MVHLIGVLGKDPILNYTPNGKAVCKFSIATNETWKDAQRTVQKKTTWHNIVTWGKIAENCKQYLFKGLPVYVQGSIDNRSWDDKETGQKKYVTEIKVTSIQFLQAKPKDPMEQRPPADSFNEDSIAAYSILDHGNNDDLPF